MFHNLYQSFDILRPADKDYRGIFYVYVQTSKLQEISLNLSILPQRLCVCTDRFMGIPCNSKHNDNAYMLLTS